MIKRFSLLLLVSGTLCAGQSVLTTPELRTQPAPQTQPPSAFGADQTPLPDQGRMGESPAPDARGEGRLVAPGAADEVNRAAPAKEAFSPVLMNGRITWPLATKSEFQRFAEDATGRRLPVYGRQVFEEVPSTFSPVENVPVPADYVLGPGDQLLIRAWGRIDLDSRVTLDRNGQINLPKVGTLTMAGLRYSQAEGFLHTAIGALFKDFELNVTLGQLRSIQIFVLGDARQPGSYTVSSLSTLVDALFTSGGPSATGTMRHIQLRREGRTTTEFDLYELLQKGDKSHDVRLLPGDVIFIPSIGPQIAVSGDVNQPGIYELKGETTVAVALEGAGGMTSLADAERAVLERIENHASRSIEEFPLEDSGKTRLVRDGDLLRVFPLSPRFSNAVTLRGSVAQPGLYPWKAGMRVSDLIPSRASLITREYLNRQNHLVPPQPEDPFAGKLTNADGNPRSDAFGSSPAEGFGNRGQNPVAADPTDALGNPRAERAKGIGSGTIASIGQNSAEINWDYALVERLDERDLSTRLIPFNLGNALDSPEGADNRLLEPGDVVTVFSRADLELPMEKHASFVRVGGEVNAPGVYRVNPGDTLRDVIQRAGGFTQHSYLYASIFTRVSTRLAQEAQQRESSEKMQRDLVSSYASATPQTGQTAADQQTRLALQQEALARLTSVKPIGRVVLEMKPDATAIGDIPDFPLEDGDSFYIPPRLSTVQVAGAVYNANAFRFQPEKRLIDYLNNAGGPTRDSDQRRTFVIRADGSVVSRQSRNLHTHGSFQNLRLLPGDAIIVPEKLRTSSPLNNILQATQLASQTALTAAALSVIK